MKPNKIIVKLGFVPQPNLLTTVEELITLPGVGKKLAERIIEARQEKRFDSLEDLERVKGVGKKMLVKLEGRVSF